MTAKANLLLLIVGALSLSLESRADVGVTQVRFFEGSPAGVRLQIDGGALIAPDRFASGPLEIGGLTIRHAEEDWFIQTSLLPADLTFAAIDGFRLELGAQTTLRIRPSFRLAVVDLELDSASASPVRLRFPDKGQAELRPGGSARFDFYPGGGYAISAGANAFAVSADGQELAFTAHSRPLLGGPLVEYRDARGVLRLKRALPNVPVRISGHPAGLVSVEIAGAATELIPGQERQFDLPNGGRLFLQHDAARQSLRFTVVKGVCEFNMEGFACWRGTASTGQSGALQWNPAQKHIDFRNDGPGPIYAQLIQHIHAAVSTGATFQFAQFTDCGSFTTAAFGGEATLVNSDTGETWPVHAGAIEFTQGLPENLSDPETPRHAVRLGWETDAQVLLRGHSATRLLKPLEVESISFGAGELEAAHLAEGTLRLKALSGAFEVRPDFLDGITFELSQSSSLLMNLDRRDLLFTAQAAADHAGLIRVNGPDGFFMILGGAARLTIVLGQNALIPEGRASWIFFEGAGGGSGFLTTGTSPGLIPPPTIDASRIPQDPVSVIE